MRVEVLGLGVRQSARHGRNLASRSRMRGPGLSYGTCVWMDTHLVGCWARQEVARRWIIARSRRAWPGRRSSEARRPPGAARSVERLAAFSDPTRLQLLIASTPPRARRSRTLAAATGLAPNTVTQVTGLRCAQRAGRKPRDGRLSRWTLSAAPHMSCCTTSAHRTPRCIRRTDGTATGLAYHGPGVTSMVGARGLRRCWRSATTTRCPITAWHDEIAAAIRDHQVVIVAGETGSGKTTQLPKICLELGRSVDRPHPAAADRRAHRRGAGRRGAAHRARRSGRLPGPLHPPAPAGDTRLKVMTDGVLLAEIAHDRDLRRYDTIIIDEAHERSLNIDFLLGYLKQLLARRPDLKIIVTSATIDTERFAAHFADPTGGAPIIEVSGPHLPGGGALPAAAGRRRGRPGRAASPTRSPSCPRSATATSSSSCPASGRSATPPRRSTGCSCGPPRCCRCTPGCRAAEQHRVFAAAHAGAGGSCWPPTSPRPR